MSQMTVSARTLIARPGVRTRTTTRVVDAAPARTGVHGFAILCALLVLATFAAVLLLNTARAEGSFVHARLQAEHTALHDQKVTLQNTLSNKESAQSLAEHARDLDMVPSTSTASLRLSDGTITGVASKVDGGRTITVDLPSTGLAKKDD